MAPLFPTPTTVVEPSELLLRTRDEIDRSWSSDGCALLRGVLDPDLVAAARTDLIERLRAQGAIAEGAAGAEWSGLPAGRIDAFALHDGTPRFVELAHSPALRDTLEAIHGEAVHLYASVQIRYALPGDDLHTIPMHQDARYINPDTAFGAFWIPLVDIPLGHGGLAFVPGSHRDGMYDHPVSRDYYSSYMGEERPQRCIPLDAVQGAWATAAFEAGDVLAFDSFIVHTALPNRSTRVRLSIDGRYQLARRPLVNWQSRLSVIEGTARRRAILALMDDVDSLDASVREAVVATMLAEDRPIDGAAVASALSEAAAAPGPGTG